MRAEAASLLKISAPELTQHHICHILLIKASHEANSNLRRWEIRLHLLKGGAVASHYKGEEEESVNH